MIKYLTFWFLFILCWCLVGSVARAQTAVKQTMPDASVIVLDTLFYIPDKAMPFDRHFTLKLSLPGKIILKGYLVYPIDHYGNRVATRRDYNLYTWSLATSRSDVKRIRSQISWENFKNIKNLGSAILTDTATYPVGKRTGVELKIPPLEPNRLYQLMIVYIDPKIGETINQLVLPIVSTLASNSSVRISSFDSLKSKYEKIRPEAQVFSIVPFQDFLSGFKHNDYLKIDTAFATGIRKYFSDKYRMKVTYKYFFSKNSLLFGIAKSLQKDRILEINTEDYIPNKQEILAAFLFGSANANKIKDVDGNPVEFKPKDSVQYGVFVGIQIEVYDIRGNKIKGAEFNDFRKLENVTFINSGKEDLILWRPLLHQDTSNQEISLKNLQTLVNTTPKYDSTSNKCLTNKPFKILFREASICPCEEKGIKYVTNVPELQSLISLFNNQDDYYIGNAQIGKISLKNPNEIEDEDVSVYLLNIQSSLESLDMLIDFSRKTLVKLSDKTESAVIASELACLARMRTILTSNQKVLKNILKIGVDFKDKQIRSWQYTTLKPVTEGSTRVIDFMSAAKFKIVPDFGFVVISNSPERGVVHDLVPYLGFNINFRSIDKNIPMREVLHKPLLYYFSFIAGITLSSIKIDQKREDLFGGKSLMTGFGFRLNNYLKIIGGGVFYKKYALNPLSDEKKIATSPFAGLSVDYEISDLLGGINKLFK